METFYKMRELRLATAERAIAERSAEDVVKIDLKKIIAYLLRDCRISQQSLAEAISTKVGHLERAMRGEEVLTRVSIYLVVTIFLDNYRGV